MFPIRDARGRAIAFGARAIAPGQEPKYLNSPDTPLFDKGRTLYNVGPARAAAAKAGTVIVTEGYMDVIALAQAGLDHAVAPLGTAITEAQLEMLWKLAPEPVVALDGDAAGLERRPAPDRPRAAAARARPLAALRADAARARTPTTWCAPAAPRRCSRCSTPRARSSTCSGRRETEGAVLDSPERAPRSTPACARISPASRDPDAARPLAGRDPRPPRRALRPAAAPASRRGRTRARGPARRRPPARIQGAGAARPSQLARAADDPRVEARIREGAILAACLHHPAIALALRGAASSDARLPPRRGSGNPRRPLDRARRAPQMSRRPVARAGWRPRLGRDPCPSCRPADPCARTATSGRPATPDIAAARLDEELTRHAALAGRAAEIREAARRARPSTADEGLTWRLRAAAEAEHAANAGPLQDDRRPRTPNACRVRQSSAQLQEPIDRESAKNR